MRVLIIIFTFSTIAIVHGQNGQLIAWGNNTGDGTDTYVAVRLWRSLKSLAVSTPDRTRCPS